MPADANNLYVIGDNILKHNVDGAIGINFGFCFLGFRANIFVILFMNFSWRAMRAIYASRAGFSESHI